MTTVNKNRKRLENDESSLGLFCLVNYFGDDAANLKVDKNKMTTKKNMIRRGGGYLHQCGI